MGIFNRTWVAIMMLFILALLTYVTVQIVDPFMAAVLAESDHGFMRAPVLATRIGLLFSFPGLGLAVIVWWIFGEIIVDEQEEAVIRP